MTEKTKRNANIFLGFAFLIGLCACENDRLEGHYAKDPVISFYKVVARYNTSYGDTVFNPMIIQNYSGEKEIFVFVGEFNRSDGKPCPANGEELVFTIESSKGEHETYHLDSPLPNWMDWADNITPYLKFIYPVLTDNIKQNNSILEIHNESDTLYAYYNSYWHGNLVKATLLYPPAQDTTGRVRGIP